MSHVQDLKARHITTLVRSKGETSRTTMVADDNFGMATVLRIFDRHRRELEQKVWGSSGAFTGFTRLSSRPAALLAVGSGAEVEVSTTVRPYLDRRAMLEVVAHIAGDRRGGLVEGVGVSVRLENSGVEGVAPESTA